MKVLIASTSSPGHLNPLLSAANILLKHNHEVVVLTATYLEPTVEAVGARFIHLVPEADIDPIAFFKAHPEREDITPGLEMVCFDVEHYFAN